jgi:hypothetical protein
LRVRVAGNGTGFVDARMRYEGEGQLCYEGETTR